MVKSPIVCCGSSTGAVSCSGTVVNCRAEVLALDLVFVYFLGFFMIAVDAHWYKKFLSVIRSLAESSVRRFSWSTGTGLLCQEDPQ